MLSQLGRHKKALDHAQSAVITLQARGKRGWRSCISAPASLAKHLRTPCCSARLGGLARDLMARRDRCLVVELARHGERMEWHLQARESVRKGTALPRAMRASGASACGMGPEGSRCRYVGSGAIGIDRSIDRIGAVPWPRRTS